MRLRKNMKRTAAAVLALSMAVSAVAAPASAAYICDVSKGDVVIEAKSDGTTTITVGGENVQDDGKGDGIIIGDNTGDNTKPTESLNAAEENTSEVEKSGENASEVEKSGETKTEGEGKTQNSATEGEDEGDEPTSQELLAPEDEEKQAQEKPADSQEPEQTEKTEQASDQVIEYDQYDPEAQKEAAKPAAKPAAEQKAEEKKPAEEKTYEDTNAPATLTEKAQEAARNVVKIINKSADALKVILRDLKVDAGESAKNAMTIQGNGDVTLELDGKNELTGGSRHNDHGYSGGHGLYCSYTDEATITIQDEDKNGSLTAVGGDVETSSFLYQANQPAITGGDGIHARNLTVSGAEIKAEGGDAKGTGRATVSSIGGAGINATEGEQWLGMVKFLDGAHITAKGGDAYTDNALRIHGGSGIVTKDNVVIEGVSISAAAGSAESTNKAAFSGSAMSIYAGHSEYAERKLSMKDSTLELTGGSAKGKTAAKLASVLSVSELGADSTMEDLTITAVAGKAEKAENVISGQILGLHSALKVGGNSTINLVGTKPGSVNVKDNTVVNLYVPEGETLKKADSVDKINAGETGKVNIYENATTTKNEDGSITVTGDLTGIKKGELQYKPTDRVEPTCTTPGKQTYTCTTEGHEGETYEETIDALGHDFVDGVCNRCGAPEQAAAENGGSSAVTLTVTGAGAYETSIADGRYVVAVPAETAVLSGCLSNLKELKAQGADTIVFRTQLRETALNIDSMLSLGVDDTLFVLTHSGESAELTVGGFAHNELLH